MPRKKAKPLIFMVDQVRALCGGVFPYARGFAWERVEHFRLEDGVLQPYRGDTILPGPGILVTTKEVT